MVKADHVSPELLGELLSHAPDAIHCCSFDLSQLHFANHAFCGLFDVTREELQRNALCWLNPMAAQDRTRLLLEIAKLVPGHSVAVNYELFRPGQSLQAVQSVFARSADGTRLDVITRALSDLPEERERERVLVSAIEHSIDGFAITDARGCYTFMNDAHAAMFGYEQGAELLGKNWSVLYHADEERFMRETVMPMLQRDGVWRGEVPGKRRDGTRFPKVISLTTLPGGRIICCCRDDSDRKRAESLAEQTHALSRALLEHAPMPVILRDQSGRIMLTNSAGRDLVEHLTSLKISIGVTELPPEMRAPDERLPLHGETRTYAARVSAAGKIEHYTCFQFLLPTDKGGQRFTCTIAIDVTKEKQSAEETRRILEQQQAYLTMQRQLVASVSHEFRTPLAAIQNATFLLANYGQTQGAEKRLKWLKILHDSTESLRALVEDVIEINHLELSVRQLRPMPMRPAALAETIADRFNTACAAPRVFVERDYAKDRERLLDRSLFGRSIENLISNALKFSPVTERVRVVLSETDDTFTVNVIDRGRGIPEQDLSRLKEPFFRAANAEGVPGTGLGLTITNRAIELHGGKLSCESRINDGTTFRFTLPAPLYFPSAP